MTYGVTGTGCRGEERAAGPDSQRAAGSRSTRRGRPLRARGALRHDGADHSARPRGAAGDRAAAPRGAGREAQAVAGRIQGSPPATFRATRCDALPRASTGDGPGWTRSQHLLRVRGARGPIFEDRDRDRYRGPRAARGDRRVLPLVREVRLSPLATRRVLASGPCDRRVPRLPRDVQGPATAPLRDGVRGPA